jgi:hypothetical protein
MITGLGAVAYTVHSASAMTALSTSLFAAARTSTLLILASCQGELPSATEATFEQESMLFDDPSESFDIHDPQADATGWALPPGTETALPPDDAIRRFFAALERGGGRPYLYYDLSDAGRYFNARTSLASAEIQSNPSGGAYVDVDLGALTVRVATHKDPSSPIPVLHVPGVNLHSLVVVKSYSRTEQGEARLDFVSGVRRR